MKKNNNNKKTPHPKNKINWKLKKFPDTSAISVLAFMVGYCQPWPPQEDLQDFQIGLCICCVSPISVYVPFTRISLVVQTLKNVILKLVQSICVHAVQLRCRLWRRCVSRGQLSQRRLWRGVMFARPGPMWSEQALSGATREPFVPTGLWRIWGGGWCSGPPGLNGQKTLWQKQGSSLGPVWP